MRYSILRLLAFAFIPLFAAAAPPEADFFKAHCNLKTDSTLDCRGLGLHKTFHCDQLGLAPQTLNGLTPADPIIVCRRSVQQVGIFNDGCMLADWVSYIVRRGEKFEVLDSKEKFIAHFGPVETKDEARAFVFAMTQSYVGETMKPPQTLSKAEVEETAAGYNVVTFTKQNCGCGSHPIFETEFTVGKDGTVTQILRTRTVNTTSPGLCVD